MSSIVILYYYVNRVLWIGQRNTECVPFIQIYCIAFKVGHFWNITFVEKLSNYQMKNRLQYCLELKFVLLLYENGCFEVIFYVWREKQVSWNGICWVFVRILSAQSKNKLLTSTCTLYLSTHDSSPLWCVVRIDWFWHESLCFGAQDSICNSKFVSIVKIFKQIWQRKVVLIP